MDRPGGRRAGPSDGRAPIGRRLLADPGPRHHRQRGIASQPATQQPLPLPPMGVRYHLAPLAIVYPDRAVDIRKSVLTPLAGLPPAAARHRTRHAAALARRRDRDAATTRRPSARHAARAGHRGRPASRRRAGRPGHRPPPVTGPAPSTPTAPATEPRPRRRLALPPPVTPPRARVTETLTPLPAPVTETGTPPPMPVSETRRRRPRRSARSDAAGFGNRASTIHPDGARHRTRRGAGPARACAGHRARHAAGQRGGARHATRAGE